MEEVILIQDRYGSIDMLLLRNGKRRAVVRLEPEAARHLAHRLMSFAAVQKTEPEVVLSGESGYPIHI